MRETHGLLDVVTLEALIIISELQALRLPLVSSPELFVILLEASRKYQTDPGMF